MRIGPDMTQAKFKDGEAVKVKGTESVTDRRRNAIGWVVNSYQNGSQRTYVVDVAINGEGRRILYVGESSLLEAPQVTTPNPWRQSAETLTDRDDVDLQTQCRG